MPVISRVAAMSTKEKNEGGRGNNPQPTAVTARPSYLHPTKSSLVRSGLEPDISTTRTRPRTTATSPKIQKTTPIAFGTTIRPERKKVVSMPSLPTATDRAASSKTSSPAVRPVSMATPPVTKPARPIATALNARGKVPLLAKVSAPAHKVITNGPRASAATRPAVLGKGGSTTTFGTGIGRQAISRNVASTIRRSASPPPTKLAVISATRQPLKDRNDVSKQDTVRQPLNTSRRVSILATRPAVRRTTGLVDNSDKKRATSVPLAAKRGVVTTGKVAVKPSVKEALPIKGRQTSKENNVPSRKNVAPVVGSKLKPGIPNIGARVTSRTNNIRGLTNVERPVVNPLIKNVDQGTASGECISDALVNTPSESSAMENKVTVTGDVDPCSIPLPADIHDDDDYSPEDLVKIERTVTTACVVPVQEYSVATPIPAEIDDAIVADKVADVSPAAHVGSTNRAHHVDVKTELATIPSIDSEEAKKDVLPPIESLVSIAPVISDSFMSIHGLHEEQVGASIEVEESAGLPANAVQVVHEIGQNYWKSIFDINDGDISPSEGVAQSDPSMDESQLAKIREEFSQPIPEPPIMKFPDWADPVLVMMAVGVPPKDLGEYTGPHISADGPIKPTGAYLPHPKAAALARQESENSGWMARAYTALSKLRNVSSTRSVPRSPKIASSPVSPQEDTALGEGSTSLPEPPTSASTRSTTPESVAPEAAAQASETSTASSATVSKGRSSLSRIFSWGSSRA